MSVPLMENWAYKLPISPQALLAVPMNLLMVTTRWTVCVP